MYSVLLVEDEEIIRKGIRNSVPWESCDTYVAGEAGNGSDGIKEIERLNPDIVVTDINMPVLDGLKMIAETKCQYNYVAIILTGYSEFQYAMDAIKNGVSDYVLKPLDIQEMKEALGRAVLESKNIHILQEKNKSGEIHLIDERTSISEANDIIVKEILDYISNHYSEKITIPKLAEEIHYSERYLQQKFQKELGTTVIEYLNRYRINKAIEIILQNPGSMAEIGYECGIGDYKYFSHVFKKYTGYSPKEYQNMGKCRT